MQRASMSVDRVVVATALLLLAVCGWWYLAAWPMPMPGGEGALTLSYLSLTAVMWLLMMIAMMTPSVAPVVMLFSRVSRQTDAPLLRTASFMSGYFSAWVAFSVVVALLQVLLLQQRWIDAMGITRSRAFSAALLVAVGVYQWLPIKSACLAHCRSPVQFLTHHYRAGLSGSWRMGVEHGLYCVGCCWVLMLLLFIGGVMNPWWIAGLGLLVFMEKLAPRGNLIARTVGIGMIATGIALIVAR